ncbi:MAG: hypothetical protein VKJ64_22095 [Leptolyngbyaceae bacterium]|nr:hypothetical protein [Leptolyngbyaceae bacterium]
MSPLAQKILQTLDILPPEKQQQVLDFVEFITFKSQQKEQVESETVTSQSFFDAAQSYIGAGEGPGDLSTNSDYMKGYGQ